MNKKELQIKLSRLKKPDKINRKLEQYFTPCSVASDMAWLCQLNENIVDKTIADFGAGVGTIGIALALLGAKKVYLIEVDDTLLPYIRYNVELFNLKNVEIIIDSVFNFNNKVDLVVQNPPFGIENKNKLIDVDFIKHALNVSNIVYSIHYLSKFTERKILENFRNLDVKRLKTYDFEIKRLLPTHKKPKHIIKVVLYRIKRF